MARAANSEMLEKTLPDLQSRLKRIEGQARGIQRMLDEQRSCEEVVNQIAALKAAVEQVGLTVVACVLESAIRQAVEKGVSTEEAITHAKRYLSKL